MCNDTHTHTIVLVTVTFYQTIIIADFTSCWILSYYLSEIHLAKIVSINPFAIPPPEHYKPCFRLKQRALQRALTALYIIIHLLDKISKHFNYNLTLLGTTAAAWVKRLNRLYSVICSYFSFVEVLLFVVNHIEC